MLWVCTDIAKFTEFKKVLRGSHENVKFVDLSIVSSDSLMEQADAIMQHHTRACVFLGYLEPGWMLDSSCQIVLRKLIRTHEVGMLCHYPESLPFSWKNEIEVLYG
jgi:hypothetical protein